MIMKRWAFDTEKIIIVRTAEVFKGQQVIVGIEPGTKEAFVLVGLSEVHDLAKGQEIKIVFQRGGPFNGFWNIKKG